MDAGRSRGTGRDMGIEGYCQRQGRGPEQPCGKDEDGVEREETEVQLDAFGK